jgi:hypothetical protein
VPHSELQWRARMVADRLTESLHLLKWIDDHNNGRISAADQTTLRQAAVAMTAIRQKLVTFSEG